MNGRIHLEINGKINTIRDFTKWEQVEQLTEKWKLSLIATLTTDDTYQIIAHIESDFKSKRRMKNERATTKKRQRANS